MTVEAVTKTIVAFMLSRDGGGGKLELDEDGWVWDSDSNWGFDPKLLAERIVRELTTER